MNIRVINKKIEMYNELVKANLPIVRTNSIWAQNKIEPASLPKQGFKLHISSTIQDCDEILKITINALKRFDVVFKACVNAAEVKKINNGLYYGESQIGKIVTIYPNNQLECLQIADTIDQLTKKYKYVEIPFDYQYKKDSNVFYRYGLFKSNLKNKITINGQLINDNRQSRVAVPNGIINPLPRYNRLNKSLKSYLLMKAIIKRGKGSTFNALLINGNAVKNCIIKEGIVNGELYYDNIDGYKRIRNEEEVLKKLNDSGANIPKVIDSFTLNKNRYLVLEQINGISLTKYIKGRNKITFEEFKEIANQVIFLLKKMQALNLVWRDCKPDNIIYNPDEKKITCIDFEGSCKDNSKQLISWSSPGFTPPECNIFKEQITTHKFDAYSLGCVMYFIITKKLVTKNSDKYHLRKIRRRFSNELIESLIKLLEEKPYNRITIDEFHSALNKA